jgi:hypothetical protein
MLNREPESPGPLKYAPKWARMVFMPKRPSPFRPEESAEPRPPETSRQFKSRRLKNLTFSPSSRCKTRCVTPSSPHDDAVESGTPEVVGSIGSLKLRQPCQTVVEGSSDSMAAWASFEARSAPRSYPTNPNRSAACSRSRKRDSYLSA